MYIVSIFIALLLIVNFFIHSLNLDKLFRETIKLKVIQVQLGVFLLILVILSSSFGIGVFFKFILIITSAVFFIAVLNTNRRFVYALSMLFLLFASFTFLLGFESFSESLMLAFLITLVIGIFKDLIWKTLLILLLFTIISNHSLAANPYDYYVELFEGWGYNIIDNNTNSDSVYSYNLYFSSDSSKPQNSYLDKSRSLVVCDSEINIDEFTRCTYLGILDVDNNTLDYKVFSTLNDSHETIYIPQQFLINPEYSDYLENYFIALGKSKNVYLNDLNVVDKFNLSSTFDNNYYYVIFKFFLSLLLVTILFYSFLKSIARSKSIVLSKEHILKIVYSDTLIVHKRVKKVVSYFLIMLTFGLLILMLGISYKDLGSLSLIYILTYIIESFSLQSLNVSFYTASYLRIFVIIYCFFVLFLLFVLTYANFFLILKDVRKNFFNTKVTYKSLVSLRFILTLFGILLALVLPIINTSDFLLVIVSLLIILDLLPKKSSSKPLKNYTYLNLSIVSFFCLILFISTYLFSRSTSLIKSDLVRGSESIVTLPYSRTFSDKTEFNKYYVNTSVPIFANNFMVYHPNAYTIVNKPLVQFSDENSYYILNSNVESLVYSISNNSLLKQTLTTDQVSSFFYINTPNEFIDKKITYTLTFDCSTNLSSSEITLWIYNSNPFTSFANNINKQDLKFMNFPGCSYLDKEVTYSIAHNVNDLPNEPIYFAFTGENIDRIISVSLSNEKDTLPIYFIDYSISDIVLKKSATIKDSLDVFTNIEEPFLIEYPLNGKNTDISIPINQLIKDHLITESPFILNSDIPNSAIKDFE